MASEDKKHAHHRTGPGGLNCPCCGPAPGPKRRHLFRTAKRRMKQIWRERINRIMEEAPNAES